MSCLALLRNLMRVPQTHYACIQHLCTATSGQPVRLAADTYETVKSDPNTPPILIMHGLFGSKQNWKSLAKAMNAKTSPTRKIITLDARNHGDSPHSEGHAYEVLAEDVALYLRENNIEKVSLIGHSMGGRVMMYFALKYPELVDRAIIVDVSPVVTPTSLTTMGTYFEVMKRVNVPSDLAQLKGRALADQQMSDVIKDKPTRDFILLNFVKSKDGSFRWRVNLEELQKYFLNHISTFPQAAFNSGMQFKGPVLFIGGGNSDYLRSSHLPDIKSIFPSSTLEFIEGAGHLVHAEKPNEFLQLSFQFLQ